MDLAMALRRSIVGVLNVEFFEWHGIQFVPIAYASPGDERRLGRN
jgi:hypothetical protein